MKKQLQARARKHDKMLMDSEVIDGMMAQCKRCADGGGREMTFFNLPKETISLLKAILTDRKLAFDVNIQDTFISKKSTLVFDSEVKLLFSIKISWHEDRE